ncbi:hypothetical protein V8F33_010168 [Rhypophila sp. PSN 637]
MVTFLTVLVVGKFKAGAFRQTKRRVTEQVQDNRDDGGPATNAMLIPPALVASQSRPLESSSACNIPFYGLFFSLFLSPHPGSTVYLWGTFIILFSKSVWAFIPFILLIPPNSVVYIMSPSCCACSLRSLLLSLPFLFSVSFFLPESLLQMDS